MKLYFFFIATILASCSTKVEIAPIRTIEIPFDFQANRYFHQCEIDKNQYYMYIDRSNKKCLYIRNIESNKLLLTVPLDSILNKYKMLQQDLNSACFIIQSIDSIYVLAKESNKVFLLNKEGHLLKEYVASKKLYPENIPFVLQATDNACFTQIGKNEFICRTIPLIYCGSRKGRLAFYNLPAVSKLVLKNDSIYLENLNIYFPDNVRKTGDSYYDFWLQFTINQNYDIISNYSPNSNLFVLSKNGTKKVYSAKSKYIEESEIKAVDSVEYFKDTYGCTINHYATDPFYAKLIYNKYQNCYFRIAKHSKSYKKADGQINNAENWSVIFLDEEFNILDEIGFVNDTIYDYKIFIPTKNGFILGMQQSDSEKENEKLRLCEFEVKL